MRVIDFAYSAEAEHSNQRLSGIKPGTREFTRAQEYRSQVGYRHFAAQNLPVRSRFSNRLAVIVATSPAQAIPRSEYRVRKYGALRYRPPDSRERRRRLHTHPIADRRIARQG